MFRVENVLNKGILERVMESRKTSELYQKAILRIMRPLSPLGDYKLELTCYGHKNANGATLGRFSNCGITVTYAQIVGMTQGRLFRNHVDFVKQFYEESAEAEIGSKLEVIGEMNLFYDEEILFPITSEFSKMIGDVAYPAMLAIRGPERNMRNIRRSGSSLNNGLIWEYPIVIADNVKGVTYLEKDVMQALVSNERSSMNTAGMMIGSRYFGETPRVATSTTSVTYTARFV
jgi:hypothetical protein